MSCNQFVTATGVKNTEINQAQEGALLDEAEQSGQSEHTKELASHGIVAKNIGKWKHSDYIHPEPPPSNDIPITYKT